MRMNVNAMRPMLHFYNGATNTFAYVLAAGRLSAAWRSADRRVGSDLLVRIRAALRWLRVSRRSPGAVDRAVIK